MMHASTLRKNYVLGCSCLGSTWDQHDSDQDAWHQVPPILPFYLPADALRGGQMLTRLLEVSATHTEMPVVLQSFCLILTQSWLLRAFR